MNKEIKFPCPVDVGFKFTKEIVFTREDISTSAKQCGDMNPLHHDEERAKSSRFGGIIACGPHTSAVYLSTVTAFLAPEYLGIGMTSEFEFRAPIRPDIPLDIKWEIKTITPKPKLGGYVVTNEGGIYLNEEILLWSQATFLVSR